MGGYFVENFGCRATQADGAVLEQQLSERGLGRATSTADAELVVLNTCTVTHQADQDVRASIRRIRRQNPQAKILVTGCYAQRAPQEIAALEGVSWVVGNSHKHQVADIATSGTFVPLGTLAAPNPVVVTIIGDIFAHTELQAAAVFGDDFTGERTRPNLKLQDGCNNRCSFCIIPSVRGRSRSLSLENAIREVEKLVSAGYREIVLSGINLGRWGRDLAGTMRFEHVLRAILERTAVEKVRISSVEPMDWTNGLIELAAMSPRVAKHAHVPLQSGSDAILRKMRRKYRPWHYADRIQRIRAAMPHAAIGADVMVGFPGETDELFEENRAFIASLPFTYLHVFTYSSRPGTPSAEMAGQVPVPVAKERNRILRELVAARNLAFRESFVGGELDAITLGERSCESTHALSDNYLKVRIPGELAPNQWLRVRVNGLTTDGLSAYPA